MSRIAFVFLLTALAGCVSPKAEYAVPAAPEAVFVNGDIYTLDPARPRASAIAVKDGRISAIGRNDEILGLVGPSTKRVDLGGRTVVPGFIDAHGHLESLGSLETGMLDLRNTKSYDELIAAVARAVKKAKPGEWIVGGRWDQANWGDKEFPTHDKLSAVSPDNPVLLSRVDGHAALANAKAMEIAGVTKGTKNPSGGEVLRDGNGDATGMFIDNAIGLIGGRVRGRGSSVEANILAAQKRCLAAGLTGVHDAGIGTGEIRLYQQLAKNGKLKLRVYGMIGAGYAATWFENNKPIIGERFTLRAAKCMIDGAMGSRGAWLIEDYSDRKGHRGLPVQPPEFVLKVAKAALKHGYQVCTHAIGDRGNREVLDAYEKALKNNPVENHRFRIEHAQMIALDDIPRFAELGVIPSMQATHCTSDMRWAEDRVGPERIKGAYAWARLLKAGCRIANGSDFPVESENPLLGFHASVTRQNARGEPSGGWRPEDRMTREEALRSFTIDAAYAAFEEEDKGSLVKGKMADFVVLSKNIMTCEAMDILKAECRMTVIGGEVVFRR